MRVALVCGPARPELDGVADAVLVLADALTGQGARVRVVHTGPRSSHPGTWRAAEHWGLLALLRAARVLRGADVVHVQFAPSMYGFRGWIGLLPLVLGRTPLVTTLHEYGWWTIVRAVPPGFWRLAERLRAADRETGLLVPRSRAVVVTNAAHEQALRQRWGGRVRAVRIPIGANVRVAPVRSRPATRRSVRRELGIGDDAVLVAFFGFVHPVKGVRYLVDAVAALRAEGRDVHLLVVGGFESMALPAAEAAVFEAELRAHVEARGMTAHTTVTGWRDAAGVSRLLHASDLGALPFTAGVTTKSGSLLTLLAHGLPTVVTAPPDPEPELADGEDCVVVSPVRDAAAIAAGLRRLLDDPELAAQIADGGRGVAASRDWRRIARSHIGVYRRALA